MRTRTATTLATAILAAGLAPLSLTAPASAAPAKHADDFNGDGYRDLAAAAPYTPVGGKTDAGAVVITTAPRTASAPPAVPSSPRTRPASPAPPSRATGSASPSPPATSTPTGTPTS